jgi:hypothetical protein
MMTEKLNNMEQNLTQSNECRIYLVVLKLGKNGFTNRIEPIDCVESKKTYVTYSKRISKDKIMKIDSHMLENHKWQHFFTYCLEGQQQEALDMLRSHIINNVKRIKSEVDELFAFVN